MAPAILKIVCGLIWAFITLTFALDDWQPLADFYMFQTVFGVYVALDGWSDLTKPSTNNDENGG